MLGSFYETLVFICTALRFEHRPFLKFALNGSQLLGKAACVNPPCEWLSTTVGWVMLLLFFFCFVFTIGSLNVQTNAA